MHINCLVFYKKFGVQQCSVLAPLLVSLCMLPLVTIIRIFGISFHCFADKNTVICFSNYRCEKNVKMSKHTNHNAKTWVKCYGPYPLCRMVMAPSCSWVTSLQLVLDSSQNHEYCENHGYLQIPIYIDICLFYTAENTE